MKLCTLSVELIIDIVFEPTGIPVYSYRTAAVALPVIRRAIAVIVIFRIIVKDSGLSDA